MDDFRKLKLWQRSHELVLEIEPKLFEFPKYQLFALSQQIRRAMYSITSNIAEGSGKE